MRTHKEGLKLIASRQSNTSAKSEDIFFFVIFLFIWAKSKKPWKMIFWDLGRYVFRLGCWLAKKKKKFRAQRTEFNIMWLHDEQVYSSLIFYLFHVTTLKPWPVYHFYWYTALDCSPGIKLMSFKLLWLLLVFHGGFLWFYLYFSITCTSNNDNNKGRSFEIFWTLSDMALCLKKQKWFPPKP